VTDNPSDPDAPAQSARRKVRPPVIELEATDVTPEEPKRAASPDPSVEPTRKPESQEYSQASMKNSSSDNGLRSSLRSIALAGFAGAILGALGVALVFIFAGDGISRFGQSSGTNALSSTDVASVDAADRAERLSKVVNEFEKRNVAIENRVAPQANGLAPLISRTESIETALSDLRRLIEQTQAAHSASNEVVAGRIAAIENRLTQPARSVIANAAEIAALGALHDAIVKGAPFAKELAAVRTILGERAAPLASFEKSAETGFPTVATLSARFTELAPKLARKPDSDSGYLTQLLAHAGRLVEVRPVGEAQGTSAGAVVARIETRLARGDLNAAVEETSKLPESAKADAANWISAATSRRDAEIAIKNLLSAALANSTAEQQK
jgi:hypothetical protein